MVAERAGYYGCTVVRGIAYGFRHYRRCAASAIVQYLAGHYLDAVAFPGSARDTADSPVVIVHGCNGSGAMRPMSLVLLLVPRERSVGNEVKAMDIIHIAISVRVRAVFSLIRIRPHIGCKVRMIVFHAFVDYRDNDGVVTARYLPPDIGNIDISPRDCGFRNRLVAGIAVMPLSCEQRVIENLL